MTGRRRFMDVSIKQEEMMSKEAYNQVIHQVHTILNNCIKTRVRILTIIFALNSTTTRSCLRTTPTRSTSNELQEGSSKLLECKVCLGAHALSRLRYLEHALTANIIDLDWEFHVIASDEKNAFVLPGGKVFVFTG